MTFPRTFLGSIAGVEKCVFLVLALAGSLRAATDVAVSLEVQASGSYVIVGEPLRLLVLVTNRGPGTATNAWVSLSNSIPGGISFVPKAGSTGACMVATGGVRCAVGNLAPRESAFVQVELAAPHFGYAIFQALAGSSTAESDGGNNALTNTVTIYAPRLDFVPSEVMALEGEAVDFRLYLATPLTRPLIVTFMASNTAAVAGSAFPTTNGTVTFAPGETLQHILLASTDDAVLRPDQSLSLRLTEPVEVRYAFATALILDNDWPPPPVLEDFESGRLSPTRWVTSQAYPQQQLGPLVIADEQPHGGTQQLKLAQGFQFPPIKAFMRMNVADYTNLVLRFWARNAGGPANSMGFGETDVLLQKGASDSMSAGLSIGSGLSTVSNVLFELALDPVLGPRPGSGKEILSIIFYNRSIYYPPIGQSGGILYAHSLVIDDIEVSGCPKDGIPRLAETQRRNGAIRFLVPTCAGRSYQLLYKNELDGPRWQVLQNIPGDGYLKILEDGATTRPHRFYRLQSP